MAESTNVVTLDNAGRNEISVSLVSSLAPSQVWEAGSGHCGKSSKHLRNFRVGTLNVNTLKEMVCKWWIHYLVEKKTFVVSNRPDTGVVIAVLLRANTQDTNCSGLETAKVLLALQCL